MDSQQKNPITEGSIYKQLLIFFFPILMGTFFQQLYNTVDAIIIGKFVGKVALGAVGGATGTIINLLVGFFTGLSSGATVIISQQYGAKRSSGTSIAVHTSLALAIACGIFMSILGLSLGGTVLRAMDTPEDIYPLAVTYLNIYFGGILFSMIYNIGCGILRAVGDAKRPLYYLIICTLLNVVLDLAKGTGENSGTTMMIVTHEMAFAEAVADRIVFLDGGVIVEEGTPQEFFHAPKTERAQRFLKTFTYTR